MAGVSITRRAWEPLAFYTLLSLAPLLLVVVAIVGLVFGHAAAQRDIVGQVQMLVGTQGAKAIEALLQGSRNTAHGIIATTLGVLTLLFGGSGVMIRTSRCAEYHLGGPDSRITWDE